MGKTPVDVLENPGYITARLVVPLINEAIMLYQEGTASKEDIDVAMRLGFGFNKGPFALADQIGLDIVLGWSEHLFRELGETRYQVHRRLSREPGLDVECLGVKTLVGGLIQLWRLLSTTRGGEDMKVRCPGTVAATSIKYKLYDDDQQLAEGLLEKIGTAQARS